VTGRQILLKSGCQPFFVGFGILGFFLIALILRTRNEILVRERRSQWVKDLINGSGQEEVNNA